MRLGILILLLFGPALVAASDAVPVASHDSRIERDAVLEAARAFFGGEDVRLDPVRIPSPIALHGGEARLLAPGVDPSTFGGTLRLALVEQSGSGQRHLAWVTVAVRRFDTVLVATRRLELHEAPGAEDIREERRETTLLGRGVLSERPWLQGKRTRRTVGEGSVLFESMFEPEPAVLHGQQLTLRVRAGSVTLSLPVVARQDGRVGEIISVQKVGSSERVMATVAGERMVEIVVR
jgi:flagella basal body P-ring formation protein FlgA